jgi:hypothetical protein
METEPDQSEISEMGRQRGAFGNAPGPLAASP